VQLKVKVLKALGVVLCPSGAGVFCPSDVSRTEPSRFLALYFFDCADVPLNNKKLNEQTSN